LYYAIWGKELSQPSNMKKKIMIRSMVYNQLRITSTLETIKNKFEDYFVVIFDNVSENNFLVSFKD